MKADERMKITVLFGSPKKDGNTARLLDLFLRGLDNFDPGGEHCVRIVYTYETLPKPCVDCGFCKTGDKKCRFCDIDGILDDIFLSDLLIIASPVYNYSFPAPLKALTDRLQRFFDKEKLFRNANSMDAARKGVLLVTSGGSGKFSFDFVEKQAKMAFMMLDTQYVGKLTVADTDKHAATELDNRKADMLYIKIFNVLDNK